jgi:FtsH-binding integral membrane protein
MNDSVNENNNSNNSVKTDNSPYIIAVIVVSLIYAFIISGMKGTPFFPNFISAALLSLILSVIPNLYFKNWAKTWMWTAIIIIAMSTLGQFFAS